MGKLKKFLGIFAIICMIGVTASAAAVVSAASEEKDTITEGVYIGDIAVGGMTKEEALEAVNAYIENLGSVQFTLTAGENSIAVSAKELGIAFSNQSVVDEAMNVCKTGSLLKRYKDKKDLEYGKKVFDIALYPDEGAIRAILEERADELNQAAEDCGLTRSDGAFQLTDGKQGIEVDIDSSVKTIASYISSDWDKNNAAIAISANIVEPRGSREELSKIQDLLGGYTTNYNTSSANRCTNLSVAASKINGTILYPGEEFSVYEKIGPMDAANGYALAGAYENGQTVESYGGGVCQVSTTLYNAVILAELEITQRSPHSMTVSYVKPSMDAAIAGDYKDFRFVNNREAPIYIEGYTVGKDIYFNIYGQETRPSNRSVRYESEIVSEDSPPTQYVGTGDPAGYMETVQSKHTGYVAQLWKIVTVDGVEQSREVFNKSTYKAYPKIVNVGTASEDPNISAVIGAALASGDEAAIQAAVASAVAAASAQPADSAVPQEW